MGNIKKDFFQSRSISHESYLQQMSATHHRIFYHNKFQSNSPGLDFSLTSVFFDPMTCAADVDIKKNFFSCFQMQNSVVYLFHLLTGQRSYMAKNWPYTFILGIQGHFELAVRQSIGKIVNWVLKFLLYTQYTLYYHLCKNHSILRYLTIAPVPPYQKLTLKNSKNGLWSAKPLQSPQQFS